MKIFHLISSGGMYGAEHVLLTLTQALKTKNIDPAIIVIHNRYNPQTELLEEAKAHGIKTFEIIANRTFDWNTIKQLREILVKNKAHIIHSHNYKSDVFAWFAQRGISTKFCITSHGWTSENLKVLLYEEIDRTIMNRADAVVCVSQSLYLRNIKHGVNTNKILSIPNGINIDEYVPSNTVEENALLKQYKDRFVIGVVGRLSPEKGHSVLIRSARLIIKKNPTVLFLFVGGGLMENELRNLTRDTNLDKHFIFLGRQKDIKKIYGSIQILVMPSLREGLPITLLEAMAMKVPVIASAVGDIPQIISNKKNGVLVAPGDDETLAEEINTLMAQPELRELYAELGRRVIVENYSASEMARKYIDLYQKVIRSKSII